MELKEEEKMLQVEETSGTEGQGAVSKPVTSTDQIITLDRLAAITEFHAQAEDFDRHADLHGASLHRRGEICECSFGRLPGLSCDDPGNRDEHYSIRTG